jgi:hypothetical protein
LSGPYSGKKLFNYFSFFLNGSHHPDFVEFFDIIGGVTQALFFMEKLLDVLSSPYAYTPEQAEYCILPATSTRPYKTFCGT